MSKGKRYGAAFVILLVLVAVFLVLNICIGSVNIPLADIVDIIKSAVGNSAAANIAGDSSTYADIVLDIRAPRALAAVILGGALALSGYLLQTFFHNPIASPFTLGISSGAKLVVAMVMVVALGYSRQVSSWLL